MPISCFSLFQWIEFLNDFNSLGCLCASENLERKDLREFSIFIISIQVEACIISFLESLVFWHKLFYLEGFEYGTNFQVFVIN